MKKAILAICAALVMSCAQQTYAPLTREQVEQSVVKLDQTLGEKLAAREDQVRRIRYELAKAVQLRLIKVEDAIRANGELMVADYYLARGWASLVENQPITETLLQAGVEAIERAVALATKEVEAEIERRSF